MTQKTRLIVNVLSNYGAFAVYGLINLFLAGYMARVLGKDLFGLTMLVLSFTMITELLGWGASLALTKHLAADIGKKNFTRFHGLVNTGMVWYFACSLIGAGICVTLSFFIHEISNIPSELTGQARLAMLLMGLKVLVCFPFNTFQSILWAYQRYDLTNLARSVGIVMRAIIIVIWFSFISTGIIELIIITIFSMLLERLIWFYSSYRLTDELKFSLQYVSKEMFWVLLSFGGFVVVTQVSNLLGYEAIKWVVSIEKPVLEVGAYSLIAMMAMFAGTMVRSIANVLMPTASSLHAQNLHGKNIILTELSTKYAMVVSGVFCILPLFLLEPFMTLWVGKTYSSDYLSQITFAGAILLVGQYILDSATCGSQMIMGMGKVVFLSVVTLSWAVSGLASVFVYLHWFNGSIIGVALIIAIARILGGIANLAYGIIIIGITAKRLIVHSMFKPTIVSVSVCMLGYVLSKFVDMHKISEFIVSVAILGGTYIVCTWFITLSANERKEFISRIAIFKNSTKNKDQKVVIKV